MDRGGTRLLTTARRLASATGVALLALALVLGIGGAALVAPAANAARQGPRSIILTPTARPATSQTVSWRTTTATRGAVEIRIGSVTRTFPARLKDRVAKRTSGENAHQYTATATGLTASTRYPYRIVTSRGPRPGTPSSLRPRRPRRSRSWPSVTPRSPTPVCPRRSSTRPTGATRAPS